MKKISVLLVVLVMILSMTKSVYAQEIPDTDRNGSITFSMNYQNEPMDGGNLTIYRVGAIVKNIDEFRFALIAQLGGSGLSLNNLNDAVLAENLTNLVRERNIEGIIAPIQEGKAVFSDLIPGLYLVTQDAEDVTEGFYEIKSFLISLPTWENGQYVYDLTGEPKNMPQHKPGQSEKPDEPKEPENPQKPEEPQEPDNVAEVLPQTGQLNWPVPILAMSGLLLFVIGSYLYFGKREHFEK